MRYLMLVLAVAFTVFVGLAGIGPAREISAQETFATPGPGEFELVPGQIGRELASGLVTEPPAAPVALSLLRFANAPGSVFTGTADDPSVGLILVESGPEDAPAGTEFTLGAGESFVWPSFVAGELRNDEPEPALTLLAYLAPAEAQAATSAAGTPAP